MRERNGLEKARVYTSLQRSPFIMGVPQDFFVVVGFLLLLTVVGSQFNFVAVLVAGVVFLLLIPLLRPVFERDPDFVEVFQANLGWRAFYPHQGRAHYKIWADVVRRSVPKI